MRIEKKLSLAETRSLVHKKYGNEKIDCRVLSEISYRKKIYLLAVFRVMTDEEFNFLTPLSDRPSKRQLSPSRTMDENILDCLCTEGLIKLNPKSNIKAFIIENNLCKGFYYDEVSWDLNVTVDDEPISLSSCFRLIYEELANFFPTSSIERSDVYSLTFNIAFHEVEDYLIHKCKELDCNYLVGKRTNIFIYQLLQHFSVSRLYGLIDLAVEQAHIEKSRNGLCKSNICDFVAIKILEIGESAISGNLKLQKSQRKNNLHRSELSKVFYELIHNLDDEGFNVCPKNSWDKKLAACYSE